MTATLSELGWPCRHRACWRETGAASDAGESLPQFGQRAAREVRRNRDDRRQQAQQEEDPGHGLERPLYAWIGFHIVFHDMRFAYGLVTSAFAREMYAGAKGGGHWMDFSRLAGEYFSVSLETVAGIFLLLCLLPPIVAVAANLARRRLADVWERLARV
jgi:hypothetical protein